MSIKFTKLSSILLITIAMSTTASAVRAEKADTNDGIPVKDVFENAYYKNAGNAFQKSSIFGQINTIFGFQKFSDQQINADGKALDEAFIKFSAKQNQFGSPVKTRDLPNPYSTSLKENPSYAGF